MRLSDFKNTYWKFRIRAIATANLFRITLILWSLFAGFTAVLYYRQLLQADLGVWILIAMATWVAVWAGRLMREYHNPELLDKAVDAFYDSILSVYGDQMAEWVAESYAAIASTRPFQANWQVVTGQDYGLARCSIVLTDYVGRVTCVTRITIDRSKTTHIANRPLPESVTLVLTGTIAYEFAQASFFHGSPGIMTYDEFHELATSYVMEKICGDTE